MTHRMRRVDLYTNIYAAIRFIVRAGGIPDMIVAQAADSATERIVAYQRREEDRCQNESLTKSSLSGREPSTASGEESRTPPSSERA